MLQVRVLPGAPFLRRMSRIENTVVGVAQLVEPRVVIPVVVGSSPIVHPIFSRDTVGGLAQLVEHRTLNPLVRGSSPRPPTTF